VFDPVHVEEAIEQFKLDRSAFHAIEQQGSKDSSLTDFTSDIGCLFH